jgi:hypothetical protein
MLYHLDSYYGIYLTGRNPTFFVAKSWAKSQSAAMTAAADTARIGLSFYCSAELLSKYK